jgi:branched-chain amino acid aminotransferase
MAFDRSRWVWMNGSIVPWPEATLHVSAHALHYGSGVFEGIRCYDTDAGPAVFRLREHLERLFNSAKLHEIKIPYGLEELEKAICELIRRNEFKSCYVRPICFFGSDTLSVHPRNCPVETAILAWPWGAYLGAEGLQQGVRVTVSPWRKFHSRMMPTNAKACGQYINSILAVRDAEHRGFDEALLLDVNDSLAEGSGENLFIVRDGALLTNDERHSILLGITRETVIELARDLGYPVETTPLLLEDLDSADEAFLTGTAVEVTPIREVDGKPVGPSAPGPITQKIQKAFFSAVSGREAKYTRWLRFVNRCP